MEENWERLAGTTSRIHAGDGGPVWLFEFGDYECPFCRRVHPVLEKLAAQNPRVTIGYRHYPLSNIHPKAEDAARASVCAEKQGRFQQMHSLLMTATDWNETEDWVALAEQAAVPDLAAFRECVSDEAVEKRLEEDKRLGEALGVTVIPTFFYRFGMQRGYVDEEQLAELLHVARPRLVAIQE